MLFYMNSFPFAAFPFDFTRLWIMDFADTHTKPAGAYLYLIYFGVTIYESAVRMLFIEAFSAVEIAA